MQLLPHQLHCVWHLMGMDIETAMPCRLPQSLCHSITAINGHVLSSLNQNRYQKQQHIHGPSMPFSVSHLLHVYWGIFLGDLHLNLPLRETSSSTRFSKFCISGGRRPISLSLSPSFLRRCNLKKFCKHGREKKQDLDLSTTLGSLSRQKPLHLS